MIRNTGKCKASIEFLEQRLLFADLRFAVMGDYSVVNGTQPEDDVAALIHSWNVNFIATVGDNNYPNGAASTIDSNVGQFYHQDMFPYTGTYGAGSADGVNHFFPALGNHDWLTSGAVPYLNYFTLPGNERYYTFQQGNVQLFMLDDEPVEPDGTSPTSIQGRWLQSSLAASTAQFKIVVHHHPGYTSGGERNNVYMQWPFAQWGATAVISGHDHDYERLNVNGTPYFVNGLGGEDIVPFGATIPQSQVRYAGDFGAMLISASSTAMTFQFYTRTGVLIDTYTQGAPVAPTAPDGLAATAASSSQINLTWINTDPTATTNKIERSLDGVNFTGVGTAAGTATSFTDTNLSSSTAYTYRVRASNGGGDSPYSNVASATTQSQSTLIAAGSTWKYLDNGSNQGTGWRATGFNDSSWKSGAGTLGYGDPSIEATTISYGSKASSKFVTTYFRKGFTVANPATISGLSLSLLRDDGAVLYLNGSEVYRSNMPSGTISNTTLASTPINGLTAQRITTAIPTTKLVAGNNVIAVELHQNSRSGPDVNFDLALSASTVPASAAAVYASDLTPVSATIGWGTIGKDVTVKGNPITLRGTVYSKGIGTHAVSQIVYNLAGAYSSFLTDVGVDDEISGDGRVIFQVLADGVKVYDSGILTKASPVAHVNLNMAGVQQLTLIANNGIADSIDYDHADWAGARLMPITTTGAAKAALASVTGSAFNTATPITSALDVMPLNQKAASRSLMPTLN